MFFKEPKTLHNLYDSHVHWLYTGQMSLTWNLKESTHPDQVLNAQLSKSYNRGDWLVGFGWDENKWPSDFKIHRSFLDKKFKDKPVLLSRTDGHSSWVNTKALELLGFWNLDQYPSDVEVDENNRPTGRLKESAHMKALFSLPDISRDQKKEFLVIGAKIFNKAGFTHIRDMTSNLEQWRLHEELLNHPDFVLHVEHWFSCENLKDAERAVNEALTAKPTENKSMKIRGIKLFADGSLGSDTAFISQNYSGTHSCGQMNWSESDIKSSMKLAWKNKLEIAIHSLGDEASHRVVRIAREVYSEGLMGRLHLEHTEILRPETIQAMKSLHIRCHMQPCHWFSDSKWLDKKIGTLQEHAFPWQALEKMQIPFSFGSDAPIEPSDFLSNLKAVSESQKPLKNEMARYHLYPYSDSPQGETRIQNDQVVSIKLGGKEIIFT